MLGCSHWRQPQCNEPTIDRHPMGRIYLFARECRMSIPPSPPTLSSNRIFTRETLCRSTTALPPLIHSGGAAFAFESNQTNRSFLVFISLFSSFILSIQSFFQDGLVIDQSLSPSFLTFFVKFIFESRIICRSFASVNDPHFCLKYCYCSAY